MLLTFDNGNNSENINIAKMPRVVSLLHIVLYNFAVVYWVVILYINIIKKYLCKLYKIAGNVIISNSKFYERFYEIWRQER